jgi:C_GCAxxG_C_C family probable redox protein
MKPSENAVELYKSGFNCAQSVFASFCEKYGIDKEQGLKFCCGFGGGVRSGEICGAVSGAVLVIGLKYGNNNAEDKDSKATCYSKTTEFLEIFKEQNGYIVCKNLLGYDISTKDGMRQAKENGLFNTTCVELVRSSAEILEKLDY